MSPETPKTIRLSAQSTWKRMGDEIVILDLNSGSYYTLNGSASFSWEKLVQGVPLEQAADDTAKEYGIPPETALADLESFLTRLKEEKLIEWV